MKPLGLYLLAFSIFWVSTWIVTDIHDVLRLEQPHPIFSIVASDHLENHSHEKGHCESACSYDHGGHLGQTLPVATVINTYIPTQRFIASTYANSWFFRITPPEFRPPITA